MNCVVKSVIEEMASLVVDFAKTKHMVAMYCELPQDDGKVVWFRQALFHRWAHKEKGLVTFRINKVDWENDTTKDTMIGTRCLAATISTRKGVELIIKEELILGRTIFVYCQGVKEPSELLDAFEDGCSQRWHLYLPGDVVGLVQHSELIQRMTDIVWEFVAQN